MAVEEPQAQPNILMETSTPVEITPNENKLIIIKKGRIKYKNFLITPMQEKILEILPEFTKEKSKELSYDLAISDSPIHQLSKIKQLKESTQPALAEKLGVTVTTIDNHLRKHKKDGTNTKGLLELGLVNRVAYTKEDGRHVFAYYKIKDGLIDVNSCPPSLVRNNSPWSGNRKAYKTQLYPFWTTFNGKQYTHHETKEERDEALEIGKKTKGDKARMYKFPEWVSYNGNNKYSVCIPNTEEVIFKNIGYSSVTEIIDWFSEVKEYKDNTVVFDSYWNVKFTVTHNGIPRWMYSYANKKSGRTTSLSASSIRELQVKMISYGEKLTKSYGDHVIDLNVFKD